MPIWLNRIWQQFFKKHLGVCGNNVEMNQMKTADSKSFNFKSGFKNNPVDDGTVDVCAIKICR